MQVRKFEAGSMQEALKLVKVELGPDAIILSAKDNSSGYGLLHQSSVEITAAIPERHLQKKKFFESRLREADKIRFKEAPAKLQKKLIENSVSKYVAAEGRSSATSERPRYAMIADEEPGGELSAASAAPEKPAPAVPQSAQTRIRSAVRAAWNAGQEMVPLVPAPKEGLPATAKDPEIGHLKEEITRLRALLTDLAGKGESRATNSSHPLAVYGLPYEMVPVQEKFQAAGLDSEIIIEVLKAAHAKLGPEKARKGPLVEAFSAQWFLDNTKVSREPFAGKVHVFAGPSGSGKTSTLVKFASQLVLREKKSVAVLSGDLHKVGAADQLKIFCKILNVPFAILRSKEDWPYLLEQLQSVDHILVDAPGSSLRQLEEIDEGRALLPPEGTSFSTHLVLPATLRDKDGYELAQRYKILKVKDLIITHVDQSSQHGLIFNLQRKTQLPLNSFGLGPKIPEDFEVATKERVLDLLYKLSQLKAGRAAND